MNKKAKAMKMTFKMTDLSKMQNLINNNCKKK